MGPLAGLYTSNNGKILLFLPGVEPQFLGSQARFLVTKHLRSPFCHLRLLSTPRLCVYVFQIVSTVFIHYSSLIS